MDLLGTIVRLQVQRSSLKVGQAPRRRYDPVPLHAVSALTVAEGGAIGRTADADPILDVHHRDHPASKNRGGSNGISVGFTAHYDAMRARLGPHLADGIAGENILVRTDRLVREDDLAAGILIETGDGAQLCLEQLAVAEPCVEFSRYAMRYPDDALPDRTVAETLSFLRDGMRGYYAVYIGEPTRLHLGDRVFLL